MAVATPIFVDCTLEPPALRSVRTLCAICRTKTRLRVIADQMIRSLPENVVFDGLLKVVRCTVCGLRYLNPAPDVRDLQHIYTYDVWADSTNANPVLMEHFYATMQTHCRTLHRVIEIGCGTGDFLAWLEGKGLETAGVEFADSVNRKKFAGPLYIGRMEDVEVPKASFDGVLLLNVIEHLSDPVAVLRKIRTMLQPGGVLIVRHPNASLFYFWPYRWTIELAKYGWHRVQRMRGVRTRFTVLGFQNQHLFYFTKATTSRLLHEAGFTVAHVSTTDPYNRLRMVRAFKSGNLVEGTIAGIRHALSFVGLGTECLFVARQG